jgi:hypothetical protein
VVGECDCNSDDTVCAFLDYHLDDCKGIKIRDFHFALDNLPCEGLVLPNVYPLGCKCVPSPLAISEMAKFTVYAFKKPKRCDDDNGPNCDDAEKVVEWVSAVQANNTKVDQGLAEACLATLKAAQSGANQKLSKKISKSIDFLSKKQSSGDSTCRRCNQSDDSCDCDVPVVPDCPFSVYCLTGKWRCELVDCCPSDHCSSGQCVRYYIEFNSDSFCHQDGSCLSEGLTFFSGARFCRLVFNMKRQFLPFDQLDCDDECGDCGAGSHHDDSSSSSSSHSSSSSSSSGRGGQGGQGGQRTTKKQGKKVSAGKKFSAGKKVTASKKASAGKKVKKQ